MFFFNFSEIISYVLFVRYVCYLTGAEENEKMALNT